jgi:5-methylcytosine-specific restriction endonuclease McrA
MTATRAEEALEALPPFDTDAHCPKCGHDNVRVTYEKNTSHYRCPIALELETSFGPEHLVRCCQRCHFTWEERCV